MEDDDERDHEAPDDTADAVKRPRGRAKKAPHVLHNSKAENHAFNESLLIDIVNGLGSVVDNAGPNGQPAYVKGKDCLDCLADLAKFLMRDHPETRDVLRQLAEWNVARRDLLPVMLASAGDPAALIAVVKVLVLLTLPLDAASLHLGAQRAAVRAVGDAVLAAGPALALALGLLADPLAAHGSRRGMRESDEHVVQLVLALVRNLLAVADPRGAGGPTAGLGGGGGIGAVIEGGTGAASGGDHTSRQRDALVMLLHRESALDLLAACCAHADKLPFRKEAPLLVEIHAQLFRGCDPVALLAAAKAVAAAEAADAAARAAGRGAPRVVSAAAVAECADARAEFAAALHMERRQRAEAARAAPAGPQRHGRFGGMFVKRLEAPVGSGKPALVMLAAGDPRRCAWRESETTQAALKNGTSTRLKARASEPPSHAPRHGAAAALAAHASSLLDSGAYNALMGRATRRALSGARDTPLLEVESSGVRRVEDYCSLAAFVTAFRRAQAPAVEADAATAKATAQAAADEAAKRAREAEAALEVLEAQAQAELEAARATARAAAAAARVDDAGDDAAGEAGEEMGGEAGDVTEEAGDAIIPGDDDNDPATHAATSDGGLPAGEGDDDHGNDHGDAPDGADATPGAVPTADEMEDGNPGETPLPETDEAEQAEGEMEAEPEQEGEAEMEAEGEAEGEADTVPDPEPEPELELEPSDELLAARIAAGDARRAAVFAAASAESAGSAYAAVAESTDEDAFAWLQREWRALAGRREDVERLLSGRAPAESRVAAMRLRELAVACAAGEAAAGAYLASMLRVLEAALAGGGRRDAFVARALALRVLSDGLRDTGLLPHLQRSVKAYNPLKAPPSALAHLAISIDLVLRLLARLEATSGGVRVTKKKVKHKRKPKKEKEVPADAGAPAVDGVDPAVVATEGGDPPTTATPALAANDDANAGDNDGGGGDNGSDSDGSSAPRTVEVVLDLQRTTASLMDVPLLSRLAFLLESYATNSVELNAALVATFGRLRSLGYGPMLWTLSVLTTAAAILSDASLKGKTQFDALRRWAQHLARDVFKALLPRGRHTHDEDTAVPKPGEPHEEWEARGRQARAAALLAAELLFWKPRSKAELLAMGGDPHAAAGRSGGLHAADVRRALGDEDDGVDPTGDGDDGAPAAWNPSLDARLAASYGDHGQSAGYRDAIARDLEGKFTPLQVFRRLKHLGLIGLRGAQRATGKDRGTRAATGGGHDHSARRGGPPADPRMRALRAAVQIIAADGGTTVEEAVTWVTAQHASAVVTWGDTPGEEHTVVPAATDTRGWALSELACLTPLMTALGWDRPYDGALWRLPTTLATQVSDLNAALTAAVDAESRGDPMEADDDEAGATMMNGWDNDNGVDDDDLAGMARGTAAASGASSEPLALWDAGAEALEDDADGGHRLEPADDDGDGDGDAGFGGRDTAYTRPPEFPRVSPGDGSGKKRGRRLMAQARARLATAVTSLDESDVEDGDGAAAAKRLAAVAPRAGKENAPVLMDLEDGDDMPATAPAPARRRVQIGDSDDD